MKKRTIAKAAPASAQKAFAQKQTTGRERTSKEKPSPFWDKLCLYAKYVPYIIGALCAACTYWALVSGMSGFLFRAQELSLFLPNSTFWQEQTAVVGGVTIWLSAWLTQFCYYPALGAAIMVVLWLGVYGLLIRLFRTPRGWQLVAWLAPLALMCTFTALGYWLYHLKTLGYLFQGTIGFIGMLAMLHAYKACRGWWKTASIPLLLLAGFPLFGFYALLGGAYMILLTCDLRGRQLWINIALSACCAALVPLFYYQFYTAQHLAYSYLALLPYCYISIELDVMQYVPYAVLALTPLFLWLVRYLPSFSKVRSWLFAHAVIAGLMVLAVQPFWYNDPNFRAELYMNRAAAEQRWDDIIARSYMETQEPTRLMVLYRNLALLRTDQGGDIMFRFNQGGAAPKASFNERIMQVGGKMIYYHYGKLNFCYRWCLEDAVEYGMKVDYIRYMLKCALYSGEKELARKYINTLKQTLFYADWAREQEALLDNTAALANDDEGKNIRALMDYNNQLDADQNLAELYLLGSFSHTWSRNLLYQEASMMFTLINKNIPMFWPRFFSYIDTHERIPIHYQEAAALYYSLEPPHNDMGIVAPLEAIPLDDAVRERFARFQQKANQNSHRTEEEMKAILRPEFGDTFYYFYFLIRDVQTN